MQYSRSGALFSKNTDLYGQNDGDKKVWSGNVKKLEEKMLERISAIQGIGLLHDANAKPFFCRKATLIYGDNGRGKSTLATVFRSLSTGDGSLISGRTTLDGLLPPHVELQFGSGHKVTFNKGAWSETRSEVVVFDTDFIERNVHSGGEVNTNHRKNLLEFALGEPAVAARTTADKATAASKKASEEVQSLSSQLVGYQCGIPIAAFEKLAPIPDADAQIASLQLQINAAANLNAISAKAVPLIVANPTFDLSAVFSVLQKSLIDVHADAEIVVKTHLAKLADKFAEGWISQGLQFTVDDTCPYCAQDIKSNDLIKAYQTHFNVAYGELKSKVTALISTVAAATADTRVIAIAQSVATAKARASAWEEQVVITPFTFDADSASSTLGELGQFLQELVHQKQRTPTDVVGTEEDYKKAEELWESFIKPLEYVNKEIQNAAEAIVTYKGTLETVNTEALRQQVHQFQAAKNRHQLAVIDLVDNLVVARNASKAAEVVKKAERLKLDTLMTATLSKYQTSINTLLVKFGASFTIENLDANFRGGAARSEYALHLRGKTVGLEGGPPSFTTALSEGDKRTLAFAFFVASTLEDAKLATRTVIVDDPMCSLDANRKHHTKSVLKSLHASAAQLIVLAHDPYFLRDLRDSLLKADAAAPISLFQLTLSDNNYTNFGNFDVDKECESAYFQHHRVLNEFSEGILVDSRAVAKAVRPMLEGYLHRRFPGLVPKSLLFGQVVLKIREAATPNPLTHAQNLVLELTEINDYVGQFHHDTNPSADTVVVVGSELKTYITRALHVVHRGEPLA